jgi:hypothetical protein
VKVFHISHIAVFKVEIVTFLECLAVADELDGDSVSDLCVCF